MQRSSAYEREPCPLRVFGDCGGGFALGLVGGTLWHGIKVREETQGEKSKQCAHKNAFFTGLVASAKGKQAQCQSVEHWKACAANGQGVWDLGGHVFDFRLFAATHSAQRRRLESHHGWDDGGLLAADASRVEADADWGGGRICDFGSH